MAPALGLLDGFPGAGGRAEGPVGRSRRWAVSSSLLSAKLRGDLIELLTNQLLKIIFVDRAHYKHIREQRDPLPITNSPPLSSQVCISNERKLGTGLR